MNANSTAIEVKGLGKRYRIGLKEEQRSNLMTTLADYAKRPLQNYRRYRSLYDFSDIDPAEVDVESPDIIWPLKNISFDVQAGEVVGIIGRNGAGKSTLLKILSKITPPTTGEVRLRGRVSSLLEVGTGFHQELTGRENIYLNGTILGMKKREVDRNFDQIVEFSGVGKFLDTPVKRYSSGMRVRLAFAVSAHLEPEILIIDEVLAVGDAQFQRKCLDKMQDVGQEGRTVLFVSHNMRAITRLCERVILLSDGRIAMDGSAHDVASEYLSSGSGLRDSIEWPDLKTAPGDDAIRLCAARVKSEAGETRRWMDIRHPVAIEMEYEVLKGGLVLLPYYNIYNDEGVKICTAIDQDSSWRRRPRPPGRYVSRAWVPGHLLNEGLIFVTPAMRSVRPMTKHFHEREVIGFQVIDALEDNPARGDFMGELDGAVRPLLKWETECHSRDSKERSVLPLGTASR